MGPMLALGIALMALTSVLVIVWGILVTLARAGGFLWRRLKA